MDWFFPWLDVKREKVVSNTIKSFLFSLAICLVGPFVSAAPTLISDSKVASAGYFTLSWDLSEHALKQSPEFELEQASLPSFADATVLYLGTDTSTVISGLKSSTFYYRVRADEGDWSKPISVVVKHHSLRRAFIFFTLGAVVFVALLAAIIGGARSSDQ